VSALVDVSGLLLTSRERSAAPAHSLVKDGTVVKRSRVSADMKLKSEEFTAVRYALGHWKVGRPLLCAEKEGHGCWFRDTHLKRTTPPELLVLASQDEQEAMSRFARWTVPFLMVVLGLLMLTPSGLFSSCTRNVEQVRVAETLERRKEKSVRMDLPVSLKIGALYSLTPAVFMRLHAL